MKTYQQGTKLLYAGIRERLLKSLPSLFDLCVISFIVILPIIGRPEIFLVWGTIGLMALCLGRSKRREYKSIPLAILTIWAGVNVFIHSFGQQGEFATQWINWCLLNEGFIYIFFGAFLIRSIVEHAKSWKLYFIPILAYIVYFVGAKGFNMVGQLVAQLTWVGTATVGKHVLLDYNIGWSMTPILAILLGLTLTLLKHRKTRVWALGSIAGGIFVVCYKWSYIWGVKWISRPDFWKAVIRRIIHSPLGHGFYHTVNTMQGFISPEHSEFAYILKRWGVGWRQNDFLEITEYLGVIALICIVWFIVGLLWKAKGGLAYFLGLSALFMCMFQRTMFFPVKGGIILVIIALLILENGIAKRLKASPSLWK